MCQYSFWNDHLRAVVQPGQALERLQNLTDQFTLVCDSEEVGVSHYVLEYAAKLLLLAILVNPLLMLVFIEA